MKVIAALSCVAAVEAGTLAVTWEDCGAKHATVTDLQPTSISTGTTETITGAGTVDEDVTSAHFTATVKAAGVKLTSCDGDASTDITCKLPLGAGSIVVKKVAYPLAAGTVTIPVDVTTSSLIPPSLAKVDVEIRATEQNGEDVICLNVHTAKQEVAAAGACSADDFAALDALPQGSASGSVGEIAGDCGKGAYNIVTQKFNHDKFKSCLVGKVALSDGCAECFAETGDYGAANCKAKCLLGWCKEGCLDCTAPAQVTQGTCMGRDVPTVDPCLETASTGACSADDFAALDALPQGSGSGSVGELAGDCGKGAYNIVTQKFNHDKFKSCLVGKVALSDGCAECFAESGDYGAANCKAKCLLGWCKEGCLDCTAPAQATQSTCMGRDLTPVDPCADDVQV